MAKEQKALEAAARTGMVADKEIAAKRKVQAGYHMERINLERQLKRRRTDSEAKVPYNLYIDPWASAGIGCCALHCADDCVQLFQLYVQLCFCRCGSHSLARRLPYKLDCLFFTFMLLLLHFISLLHICLLACPLQ